MADYAEGGLVPGGPIQVHLDPDEHVLVYDPEMDRFHCARPDHPKCVASWATVDDPVDE